MKFCLNSNQSKEYLEQADEIMVPYKDREYIFDLIEKYKDKTYILNCYGISDINWEDVKKYNKLTKDNLIVCGQTLETLSIAQTLGIKRYLGFQIESFWELSGLQAYEPYYIIPGPELFFQMDNLKKVCGEAIKIRIAPNIAYQDNLPHFDGVCGTWVRPEDLETVYGNYIDTVEFADCDKDKEQILFRIYAKEKEWRTDLQIIITNLDISGVNRMIESSISQTRLNCGQKCLKGSSCRICPRALILADPKKILEYQENAVEER